MSITLPMREGERMTDDKPTFTRKQLDEWQRKDQRKRQASAERTTPDDTAPVGRPLWLDKTDDWIVLALASSLIV